MTRLDDQDPRASTRRTGERFEVPGPGGEPEVVDQDDLPREERVTILAMTDLAFDGRADSTQVIPLAVGVDSSRWTSATLVVLLKSTYKWSGTATLYVQVEGCALDPSDPRVVFEGAIWARVSWDASTTPPDLRAETVSAPLPGALAVKLLWVQGSEEADTLQLATLAVYLVGRLDTTQPSWMRVEPEHEEAGDRGRPPSLEQPRADEVAQWIAERAR